LKKTLVPVLLLMLIPAAFPQANLGGTGLSRGTGAIGQRSGQDVDLRYFANATGVYDTGMTPLALTSEGSLVKPGGLVGVEAGLGAYGKHTFRRSVLGLDYAGNFRHYPKFSTYDGSNQQLNLEYTLQKSRRLLFDFSGSVGTQSFGTAISTIGGFESIVDQSSLLFDNRTSYYQTAMHTRYALTQRTVMTMGGTQYSVHRKSSSLVGVNGYTLDGSLSHQIGRNTIIGVSYQHLHFDFPRAFGESDINSYTFNWARQFGRTWDLSLSAGAFTSEVQGVQNSALDPVIAALLGISTIRTVFYSEQVVPMGSLAVSKRFRRGSLEGQYARRVTPGNGVFLTSRQETIQGTYSYSSRQSWSFSAGVGQTKLESLGQNLFPFSQIFGTTNVTYQLGGGIGIGAGYSRRHRNIRVSTFPQDSSRISISIYFSPGESAVSLH
jgi:hypothetical protein